MTVRAEKSTRFPAQCQHVGNLHTKSNTHTKKKKSVGRSKRGQSREIERSIKQARNQGTPAARDESDRTERREGSRVRMEARSACMFPSRHRNSSTTQYVKVSGARGEIVSTSQIGAGMTGAAPAPATTGNMRTTRTTNSNTLEPEYVAPPAPERLPLNRPLFPLSRWHSPLIGLVVKIGLGSPGISPLMYCATSS